MTWTYSGNPAASDRDWIRFNVGDTDTTGQQLTDEEIAAVLSEEGSKEAAALAAVQALAAKYSRLVDQSIGDLSISYSQLAARYDKLAKKLTGKLALRKATPFAGGISIDRKDEVKEDTDRVRPAFERAQFDRITEDEETD